MRRTRRERSGWATAFVAIPVVTGALWALGLFVPIPVLSAGSAALAGRFPWILAYTVVWTLLALILWARSRTWARGVLAVLGMASVAGACTVAAASLQLAQRQGVEVDWQALLFAPSRDANPAEWVVYDEFEGRPLTIAIWRPAGDPVDAPVIFMTHGGGWISGSVVEGQSAVHAQWFAERGYLVVGANYSLASREEHLWDTQDRQLGCALVWLNENAAEYGGDITRLGAIGDSAGGNLVMQVAYKAHSGLLRPTCEGEIPQIDALSVLYPGVDLRSIYENPDPLMGPHGVEFGMSYIGGSPDQYPARYRATNPGYSATTGAPPTLIALGTHDHLVPPEGTLAAVARLEALDIPIELIEIPFAEHSFDRLHPGGIGTQIWHTRTLEWFESHGVG